MRDSVLERYALAYIKKFGSSRNVQEFLRYFNGMQNLTWDEAMFANAYKECIRINSINGHNIGSERDDRQPTSPKTTHIHVHNNRGLDFWDYFLLRSLFSGNTGHTTVINNSGFGSGSQPSREDKKKDSEDNRKLLALGIAAAVVCVAFHAGVCFWYNSSRKAARKEEKIDYLDNKLKMLRNIEFAVGAVSLAALVACVVYPVLPVWGLVILGVNSLVCFAGGLAFHMKHKKESEDIEKAREAVGSYLGQRHDYGDSSHYGAPPPYFPQDPHTPPTAPPYSEFDNPNKERQSGNCERF